MNRNVWQLHSCTQNKNTLENANRKPPTQCCVLYRGVQLEKFSPVKLQKEKKRKQTSKQTNKQGKKKVEMK